MIPNIFRNFELDFNKIEFSDIEKSYDNSYSFIRFSLKNDNTKICIQSPILINDTGLLINTKGNFYLKLKTNTESLEFNEFITMMDQYIIEKIFKTNILHENWGNELFDYTKRYIYSIKNENNNTFFISKLQKNFENNWSFEIYDSGKKLINECNFNKYYKIKAIFVCDGIWFSDNNFGLIWSIGQIQVIDTKLISGFSIIEDENKYNLF